jgi:beta-lactam-binding protein with PASTA domain
MNPKPSRDKSEGHTPNVWKNIIWGLIAILAITLVADGLLALVTRHNHEITVPSFTGMNMKEAKKVADSAHVRLDVTDSVYIPRMAHGAIFSQNPPAGSRVKKGRRILLTQNAVSQKMVSMPQVVGFSLRQAKTEIAAAGLQIGKLIYQSDMATNNVLAQKYRGGNIARGKKIPSDAEIDLVLGLSDGDANTYVPYVVGMKYSIAKDMLQDNSLNVGNIFYDRMVKSYSDSTDAIVYKQNPNHSDGGSVRRGTAVNLYLTTDQSKVKNAE